MKTLVFNATDTLFFRESRPMEAQGELQSVFPPPVRTLAGAARSLIGEQMGVNWDLFKAETTDETCKKLRAIIGFGEDDLGRLKFKGAWLMQGTERLYPAPLHIMQKDDVPVAQLRLDTNPVRCDLGTKVRLPVLDNQFRGTKSLENTWLTQAGMQTVLQGKLPTAEQLKKADKLFTQESRLGIARDYKTRAVRDGLLYQTKHIRPQRDVSIALEVKGLPDDFPTNVMLRLGAEGRSASVKLLDNATNGLTLSEQVGSKFALYLLTPLHRGETPEDQPLPSFTKEQPEQDYWQGNINGVDVKLYGAVTGKMQREGGWDLANHRPKDVMNLIPAGSVFFCELVDQRNPPQTLKQLHLAQHGAMTDYGYGQFAVGIWND
jgi:CRISPR-associated protein Cmr3